MASGAPSITAPIVSATNLEQLDDLIASVELKLDRSSIELLNQASAYAAVPPVELAVRLEKGQKSRSSRAYATIIG